MFDCLDSVSARKKRIAGAIMGGDVEYVVRCLQQKRPGTTEFVPEAFTLAVNHSQHHIVREILNHCMSVRDRSGLTCGVFDDALWNAKSEAVVEVLLSIPTGSLDTRFLLKIIKNKWFRALQKFMANPIIAGEIKNGIANDMFGAVLTEIKQPCYSSTDKIMCITTFLVTGFDIGVLLDCGFSWTEETFAGCLNAMFEYCGDLSMYSYQLLKIALKMPSVRPLMRLLGRPDIMVTHDTMIYALGCPLEYWQCILAYPQCDVISGNFELLRCVRDPNYVKLLLGHSRVREHVTAEVLRECIVATPGIATVVFDSYCDSLNSYHEGWFAHIDNIADLVDETIIRILVDRKNYHCLKLLIDRDNLTIIPEYLYTKIMDECCTGHVAAEWNLFEKLFSIGIRPSDNAVAQILYTAIDNNQIGVVCMVLPYVNTLESLQYVLTYAINKNIYELVSLVLDKHDLLTEFDMKRVYEWAARNGIMPVIEEFAADERLTDAVLYQTFIWACVCGQYEIVQRLLEHPHIHPAQNNNAALVRCIRLNKNNIVGLLMRDSRVVAEVTHSINVILSATRNANHAVQQTIYTVPYIADVTSMHGLPPATIADGIDNSATIAFRLWNEMTYSEKSICIGEMFEEAITQDDIVVGEYAIINGDEKHIYSLESIKKILNSSPFNPTDPFTRQRIIKITRIMCVPTPSAPAASSAPAVPVIEPSAPPADVEIEPIVPIQIGSAPLSALASIMELPDLPNVPSGPIVIALPPPATNQQRVLA